MEMPDLNMPVSLLYIFFPRETLFLIILSHFYLSSLIVVNGSWKGKKKIPSWNSTFTRLHGAEGFPF